MRSLIIHFFVLLGLFFSTFVIAAPISNDRVFAFAEGSYPSLFPGTAVAQQFQQYNYRYYPVSGNYLAVDTSGMIFMLGPSTKNVLTSVGPVTNFESAITAWEGTLTYTKTILARLTFDSYFYDSHMGYSITTVGYFTPKDIATDGINLYVALPYKILKIAIATGVITTLAGANYFEPGCMSGQIMPCGPFDVGEIIHITTDGTSVYVDNDRRVLKIVISTGVVTTLADLSSPSPFHGLTTDGTSLYAIDGPYIRKIVIGTGEVTTLVKLIGPSGLTTDGTSLYAIEGVFIRKIVIRTGEVTTLAGGGKVINTEGGTGGDGVGTAASFSAPNRITTDGTNLYVSDFNNRHIRKVVIATGVVTTLAGSSISPNPNNLAIVDGKIYSALASWPAGSKTSTFDINKFSPSNVLPTCSYPQVLQNGDCVVAPTCTSTQVLQNGVCVTSDPTNARNVALACQALPYTGASGTPQVDTGCQLVQFDACLSRAGYKQYDTEAIAECSVLNGTTNATGSKWSCLYCSGYPNTR